MNLLRDLRTRLHGLFRKRELDADMDDEMRSHTMQSPEAATVAIRSTDALSCLLVACNRGIWKF